MKVKIVFLTISMIFIFSFISTWGVEPFAVSPGPVRGYMSHDATKVGEVKGGRGAEYIEAGLGGEGLVPRGSEQGVLGIEDSLISIQLPQYIDVASPAIESVDLNEFLTGRGINLNDTVDRTGHKFYLDESQKLHEVWVENNTIKERVYEGITYLGASQIPGIPEFLNDGFKATKVHEYAYIKHEGALESPSPEGINVPDNYLLISHGEENNLYYDSTDGGKLKRIDTKEEVSISPDETYTYVKDETQPDVWYLKIEKTDGDEYYSTEDGLLKQKGDILYEYKKDQNGIVTAIFTTQAGIDNPLIGIYNRTAKPFQNPISASDAPNIKISDPRQLVNKIPGVSTMEQLIERLKHSNTEITSDGFKLKEGNKVTGIYGFDADGKLKTYKYIEINGADAQAQTLLHFSNPDDPTKEVIINVNNIATDFVENTIGVKLSELGIDEVNFDFKNNMLKIVGKDLDQDGAKDDSAFIQYDNNQGQPNPIYYGKLLDKGSGTKILVIWDANKNKIFDADINTCVINGLPSDIKESTLRNELGNLNFKVGTDRRIVIANVGKFSIQSVTELKFEEEITPEAPKATPKQQREFTEIMKALGVEITDVQIRDEDGNLVYRGNNYVASYNYSTGDLVIVAKADINPQIKAGIHLYDNIKITQIQQAEGTKYQIDLDKAKSLSNSILDKLINFGLVLDDIAKGIKPWDGALILDIKSENVDYKFGMKKDTDGNITDLFTPLKITKDTDGKVTAIEIGDLKLTADNLKQLLGLGSDAVLSPPDKITFLGDDNWLFSFGTDSSLRIYKNVSWKGIALANFDGERQMRFWKDLKSSDLKSTDNLRIVSAGALSAIGSDLSKLEYNFDNNVILRKDENEWKFAVFKLGQQLPSPTRTDPNPTMPENKFNKVQTFVIDADTNPNAVQITIDGNINLEILNSQFNKILGREAGTEIKAQDIREFTSQIFAWRGSNDLEGGQKTPYQLILKQADGKYKIVDFNQDGTKFVPQEDDKGDIKSMIVAWDILKGKLKVDFKSLTEIDITDSRIFFDTSDNTVKITASVKVDGENREGYAYKVFDENGNEKDIPIDERLTPQGSAYKKLVEICPLLKINPPTWDVFKGVQKETNRQTGEVSYILQVKDWQNNDVRIWLDSERRVTQIAVNFQVTQSGATADSWYRFEWQDDGTAKVTSGVYKDVKGNQWPVTGGKFDPNSKKLELELQRQVQDAKDRTAPIRSKVLFEFDNNSNLVEKHMELTSSEWCKSVTTILTYNKTESGWNPEPIKAEIYSSNTEFDKLYEGDYIEYTYPKDNPNVRQGKESFGGKTAEWTETSEKGKFVPDQENPELAITINGERINRETGEVQKFDNVTVTRRPLSGVLGIQDNKYVGLATLFLDENEIKKLISQTKGLGYVDLISASPKEVEDFRIKYLLASGFGFEDETEAKVFLDLLMTQSIDAAFQEYIKRVQEALVRQYGQQAQQAYEQWVQSGRPQQVQAKFQQAKAVLEALGDNLKMAFYDVTGALLKVAEANPGEVAERSGQQASRQQVPGGGGGAGGGPAGGAQQPQPGGGQAPQTPPVYNGRDINAISENRIFDPEEGIFGTDDPDERIDRINSRYPGATREYGRVMGMSPEEWLNKFHSLTKDDARRKWLNDQNLEITAQKLRTGFLKGLGMNDEQISQVMSLLGNKDACIEYLMQALGISREEAEAIYNMLMSLGTEEGIRAYLEKLGYSEEEINEFIEKMNKMKEEKEKYLREVLGIEDEDLIEELLGLSKEEATAKLKELGYSDEEIADYFALEDEVRKYLKDNMAVEDDSEIDMLLTLNEEGVRTYLQNKSLDIDIDEFLGFKTDEEKLEYLKNYFINEKGMSEEEALERAQQIMDKIKELPQGEEGDLIDKAIEMFNFLEENRYYADELLKAIGLTDDKVLEFRKLEDTHAKFWFLEETLQKLIAEKNPDMSEEEVKENAKWLTELIIGSEIEEDMRLIPVSARGRMQPILDAWNDAAEELGLDRAGINDRLRDAFGGNENATLPGNVNATLPGNENFVNQLQQIDQIVTDDETTRNASDDEIEAMLERIVDRLIVSLLTGEMFPENAREVALEIMREESEGFDWGTDTGNGDAGNNNERRDNIPLPENWTRNTAPWEEENVDMNEWFERFRDRFDNVDQYLSWRQAWRDWIENILRRASETTRVPTRGKTRTQAGRGL